ncbi:hypothetical protein [Sulfitobacter guttiformis]|uniref:Uncharacterized protein n=1 Tax=Sulfitobacter guttiformis TaxID=74349 RepID=A0A420DH98_9RHOB|nr:hypothetical protein [Sulfitobacter guttiformis]KIN72674.1 hypothetical protein Z949_1852 [Sulfitobacter guttiformis KCTC 32187]RKE93598.1 hypothetical protein C8N30_2675 [Sulfitobacter guttiformis]
MINEKYTRLKISTLTIPAWADWQVTESVRLISQAADLRRTVNGELVNVARSTFRKYSVDIRVQDHWAAGLSGIDLGSYCEVIPSEHFSLSVPGGAVSAKIPRAGIEVVGITDDGVEIPATSQPTNPLPLQTARAGNRIGFLRVQRTVSFSTPVVLVRYRPVLACLVTDWTTDSDEAAATASWTISLEEV